MRAVPLAPRMREEVLAKTVLALLARASGKGFRLLQYSIQEDHLHLIAEADDGLSLSRGIQRVASRIALVLNSMRGRRGSLWRGRYHRRDLTSPRQFRNALVYVLFNARKHAHGAQRRTRMRTLDLWSSVIWVDDWASEEMLALVCKARAGPRPTAIPTSWIARTGWKRHGALVATDAPKSID
jgi:putative transposase